MSLSCKSKFPSKNIKPLASARSAGKELPVGDKNYVVEELTKDAFEGVDIAFFPQLVETVQSNLAMRY